MTDEDTLECDRCHMQRLAQDDALAACPAHDVMLTLSRSALRELQAQAQTNGFERGYEARRGDEKRERA